MTEGTSRKGMRLPWLGDEQHVGSADATNEAATVNEQSAATAVPPGPTSEPGSPPLASGMTAAASVPAAPVPAPVAAAADEGGPFLQDLVAAMRQITEEARDDALTQMRASVAERTDELMTGTEQRAAELRELADAEIVRIGDWEKGELQRVRDEAAAKVTTRKTRLEAQLNANTASGESATKAVEARIDAFEREMAGFFAQLNDLHDPVAFASAVKRMPRPPSLADTPATPAEHIAPTPAPAPTAEAATAPPVSPPAWPREPAAVTAEPVATEAPAAAAPAPEAPATEAPAAPAVPEVITQVLVTGLSSFGAITSFKQSLERVDGVQRVTMGLGTSGEFIFTAAHAAGFDLGAAIRSFESAAQFVATGDQLRVSVGSKD